MEDKHPKLKELYKKLVSDLSKDPSSEEIQQIAEEITNTAKKDYEIFKIDNGDDYWYSMAQIYLLWTEWIKAVDNKYGNGASKFICLENKRMDYDLPRDPISFSPPIKKVSVLLLKPFL